MTLCHSSGVRSCGSLRMLMPALLKRMSMRPRPFLASLTTAAPDRARKRPPYPYGIGRNLQLSCRFLLPGCALLPAARPEVARLEFRPPGAKVLPEWD